jgi:hypothetical protein
MEPVRQESDELLDSAARLTVLLSVVGLWKDRTDLPDTEQYVRELREGERLRRLSALWKTPLR